MVNIIHKCSVDHDKLVATLAGDGSVFSSAETRPRLTVEDVIVRDNLRRVM